MNKLLTILILITSFSVYGQLPEKRNGIKIEGGITGRTIYGGVGYLRYILPKVQIQVSALYESFSSEALNYVEVGTLRTFYFDITGSYQIARIKENIYFNILAGVSGAKEKLFFKAIEREPKEKVIFGGLLGGEIAFRLSQKVHVSLSGNQRIYSNSSIGSRRWMAGLGIKYNF